MFPSHGKAEEVTNTWISIGGGGLGKKIKSVVVMSAVDLGHRGVQMSPSPLLKGSHMEHPARG